jgi:hypothetical protein
MVGVWAGGGVGDGVVELKPAEIVAALGVGVLVV